ncbi:MAG: chloride channel protein [Rhodospirillales bacterium]|nr:chloride channel protein [Rhodospirillales bacterium]
MRPGRGMNGRPAGWRGRLRRYARLPLLSPRQWLRRAVFWLGAVVVALIAIGFAWAANEALALFLRLQHAYPLAVFVVAPAGLAVSVLLTRTVFPGAQGSGIPQTIAALHMHDTHAMDRVLSLKVAFGKIALTLLGLACGASIGREGPTVQIGAAVMHAFGRLLRLPRIDLQRSLVLAGGAAGVAAAFNTPLAGIIFGIEELSHSFEARTSGVVIGAVSLAGITTLALAGNYSYFGTMSAQLGFGAGWIAVVLCAIDGGFAGGGFSQVLISAARGVPGRAGRFVRHHPVGFAALCGLMLALIGVASSGSTYGTGYAEARGLLEGHSDLPASFALFKLLATAISYLSGIPGGIFAPSLAVGAGLGQWLAHLVPGAPSGAMVLLGMVAYFSGATHAPITATVIVMEMTDNQQMTISLLLTALLAFGVSRLVCRRPLYSTLAHRFAVAVGEGARR